jgi:hypothetical protein
VFARGETNWVVMVWLNARRYQWQNSVLSNSPRSSESCAN